MARTKHTAAGKAAPKVRLILLTQNCGKAKNKRFPYSSVTMRRSLGAYRRSTKYPDNDARLRMVMSQYGLREPSRAPRKQLCRYVSRLNRRPSPGSKARRIRSYLRVRAPSRAYPNCVKGYPCGRTCLPLKLASRCSAE